VPYPFDRGDKFGRTLQLLHGSVAASLRHLWLQNQKLIGYRVYLSAASMKLGKELDEKFQILIGTIHALRTELRADALNHDLRR